MNATEVIGSVAFIAFLFGGAACWVISLVNMFRTLANRKEGVPLFQHWYESPFNILFKPALLTERGLTARRWVFYGFIGFWVCCGVGAAIGLLTGVAH